MSFFRLFRLILGIAFLALGLFWLLARDRIKYDPNRPGSIHPTLSAMIGPAWLLIGVAWLIAAFA